MEPRAFPENLAGTGEHCGKKVHSIFILTFFEKNAREEQKKRDGGKEKIGKDVVEWEK